MTGDMHLASLPSRRIRRLELRAPSTEHAQRAATLFEDALRTATMPTADTGRLVLIRRLNLGRIPAGSSAVEFAQRLERAVRDAPSVTLAGESLAAGDADVVSFPDRAEALVQLARRLARHQPASEWFWTMAVPGWTAQSDPATQWLVLLEHAHDQFAPATVVSAIVHEAVSAGVMVELLDSLPEGIGDIWLRQAGFDPSTSPNKAATPKSVSSATPLTMLVEGKAPVVRFLQTLAVKCKFDDDRLLWLTTMLAVNANSNFAADVALPSRVSAWLAEVRENMLAQNAADLLQPVVTATGGAASSDSSSTPRISREPHAADFSKSTSRFSDGEATDFGGLFFVVPVLRRLGFEDWLAEWRIYRFPFELLEAIGARMGMRDDDPILGAVRLVTSAPTADGESALKFRGDTSAVLPLENQRQFLAPDDSFARQEPAQRGRRGGTPLQHWINEVRRWCRRRARLGLHSLIVRPARVMATRTQVDVVFPLARADLRIRRAALDIDPGWVPWLGRIIRFHYHDDDD